MNRITMTAAGLALCFAAGACVKKGATSAKVEFGTTHVTLYDCGLAQIERQAEILGESSLTISVEQAHVDDLLASLILATDGSVKVRSVKFPGMQNLGQAVASSSFAASMLDGSESLEIPSDIAGYARALVGTKVVITGEDGSKVEGTVLDAVALENGGDEDNGTDGKGKTAESSEPLVVIVTSKGALRWIPLSGVLEVAPVSKLEAAAIKSFSSAMGKASGFTETTLEFETAPGSKGTLAASYIRQSPVWRMLYKTTVEADKVFLEAWAVVYNDTPEDWEDVSMTLVAGMPTSYVLSVASPRYVHREVIEAPGKWDEMAPQLGAHTPDTLLYDWDIYHAGTYGYGGLGAMGYGSGGGGSAGYGSAHGSIGYGGISEKASSLIKVGQSAAEETMVADVEQEISTYTSMSTVSLPSGATSLVPLVRRELPGQSFTQLVDGGGVETCLRMENTTGLVLQPGMSSFYEDGRFRGQDDLDRVEPADVRVLCYGHDPDVSFKRELAYKEVHTALEWRDNQLWVHTLRTTTKDYSVENFAGQPRDLAIPISHIINGRVVTPSDLATTDSDTDKLHIFKIAPRSEMKKKIVVEEGVMKPVYLTTASFEKLLESPDLPEKHRKVLESARVILVKKEKIEKEIAATRELISKNEETIKFQTDLLSKVPKTDGKSKAVDTMLGEIMQAKKQIMAHNDQIKELDKKAADLLAQAREELKTIPPPE
ncbi:MAG: DUF4139 domain-containing protein [Pseudomonadota bacterium]